MTPPSIYDVEEKQQARERVWRILSDVLKDDPNSKALLLAGPKDHEARVAMNAGFSLDNLIFVEKNPVVLEQFLACFNSEEFARLNVHLDMLSDAARNLAQSNTRIHVAHLDFCGTLSACNRNSVAVEIHKFIRSNVMEVGLLAISILRGHDKGVNSDDERLRRLQSCVDRRLNTGTQPERKSTLLHVGGYNNPASHNSMLYGIFQIERIIP